MAKLPHKWNIRKGYLKILHVPVDVKKKKIISLEVTSEEVHDGSKLKKLVDNLSSRNNNTSIKRIIADAAHDSNENFRYLYAKGIEAAIKVRKNSSLSYGSRGCCNLRNKIVLKQLKDFRKWKHDVTYGYIDGWQKQHFLPSRECLANMWLLENIQTW